MLSCSPHLYLQSFALSFFTALSGLCSLSLLSICFMLLFMLFSFLHLPPLNADGFALNDLTLPHYYPHC